MYICSNINNENIQINQSVLIVSYLISNKPTGNEKINGTDCCLARSYVQL